MNVYFKNYYDIWTPVRSDFFMIMLVSHSESILQSTDQEHDSQSPSKKCTGGTEYLIHQLRMTTIKPFHSFSTLASSWWYPFGFLLENKCFSTRLPMTCSSSRSNQMTASFYFGMSIKCSAKIFIRRYSKESLRVSVQRGLSEHCENNSAEVFSCYFQQLSVYCG